MKVKMLRFGGALYSVSQENDYNVLTSNRDAHELIGGETKSRGSVDHFINGLGNVYMSANSKSINMISFLHEFGDFLVMVRM
jgi:hypothetical protein